MSISPSRSFGLVAFQGEGYRRGSTPPVLLPCTLIVRGQHRPRPSLPRIPHRALTGGVREDRITGAAGRHTSTCVRVVTPSPWWPPPPPCPPWFSSEMWGRRSHSEKRPRGRSPSASSAGHAPRDKGSTV